MNKNNIMLLVDFQNDFIDDPNYNGNLAVPNAYQDVQKCARFLQKNGAGIDELVVSLDTHHVYDIAHTAFWLDAKGKYPLPFTAITYAQVKAGFFKPANEKDMEKALNYLIKLEEQGRFSLVVWPNHCIENSYGAQLHPLLAQQIAKWEHEHQKKAHYVEKGMNSFTEHFSIFKAEVVDNDDKGTQLNRELIEKLQEYQNIYIAGEALSHCVYNSVVDLVENFSAEAIKRCTLLSDCSSPVAGFEEQSVKLWKELQAKGIQCILSTDIHL